MLQASPEPGSPCRFGQVIPQTHPGRSSPHQLRSLAKDLEQVAHLGGMSPAAPGPPGPLVSNRQRHLGRPLEWDARSGNGEAPQEVWGGRKGLRATASGGAGHPGRAGT